MIKTLIAATTAAAVMGPALVCAPRAEVTAASWGGAYMAAQQKAYGASWARGGNKNIDWVKYNGSIDEVRAQVSSGTATWDVVDVLGREARIGCDEGLFKPLDRGRFPKAPDGTSMDDDIMAGVPNDCVVPQVFWSYMAFTKKGIYQGEQPSTIDDFFDLGNYPGQRGIHARPNALVEMALLADGVAPDDVYDVMSTGKGIDRAFAKLDALKGHAVFWSAGAESLELVQSGEAAMAIGYNGWIGAAVLNKGAELVAIWDGQVLEREWWVMLNGAPNEEAAMDFLIHAATTASQARMAKFINYGPMRASALEMVKANEPWYHTGVDILPYIPNRDDVMDRSVFADPGWWADNGDAVAERYAAWMEGED